MDAWRTLVGAVLLAAAVVGPGCGGRLDGTRAEGEEGYVVFDMVMPEGLSGEFEFDSITTTDLDVSGEKGSINWASLEATAPGQNLSFLNDVVATARRGDKKTLATLAPGSMPAGATYVELKVDYHGDIVPYFSDGHHLETHWRGHIKGVVPKGGVAMRCRVGLKL